MSDFKAIVEKLSQDIPANKIKTRDGGRMGSVAYIEWSTCCEILNEHAGGWTWNIARLDFPAPGICCCIGVLTIEDVSREGVGIGDCSKDYDMGVKAAASDALKRAATLFNVGIGLYGRDGQAESMAAMGETTNPRSRSDFERAAQADAAGDDPMLATPKQLAMIHAICKGLGKDAEKGANYYHQTSLGKLSRAQASEFITTLKALQAAQPAGVK